MQELLVTSVSWIIDVVFFVILILGIIFGIKNGFVKSICNLAGKWIALIFAICFCVSFANFLENLFGMTSAITNGLANAFAGKENFDVGLPYAVTGAEISTALEEIGIGKFYIFLIGLGFKNVEVVPEGTTAAHLLGSTIAKWLAIVISFILLLLIIRLAFWLLAKLFKSIIDRITPIRIIDQSLGGIFGLIEALIFVFLILLVCNWIPITSLHEFISSSSVVGAIFKSEWFSNATSYAISGQWFNDYIADVIFQ